MIDRAQLIHRVRDAASRLPAFDVCGALFEGRARIVDCFDHGELRFVVVEPDACQPALTDKERTVVQRLAQELSNKVVALDLSISQATASALLGAALRKLGVDRGTLLRVLAALPTDQPLLAKTA